MLDCPFDLWQGHQDWAVWVLAGVTAVTYTLSRNASPRGVDSSLVACWEILLVGWQSRELRVNSLGHGGDHWKVRESSFPSFSSFPWTLSFPSIIVSVACRDVLRDEGAKEVALASLCSLHEQRCPATYVRLLTNLILQVGWGGGGGEWTLRWTSISSWGNTTLQGYCWFSVSRHSK